MSLFDDPHISHDDAGIGLACVLTLFVRSMSGEFPEFPATKVWLFQCVQTAGHHRTKAALLRAIEIGWLEEEEGSLMLTNLGRKVPNPFHRPKARRAFQREYPAAALLLEQAYQTTGNTLDLVLRSTPNTEIVGIRGVVH